MSYKVEVTAEEHEAVLRGALTDWTKMDPDVHLVSTEGHKIFSHKILLSFYSSHLQQLLNVPVVMFSSQPVTISVPASAATVAILLKMLVTGKSGTSQREILGEVREAARALGINMRNCFVDGKKSSSSGSGLTVIKLPVNSDTKINAVPARMPGPKPYQTLPNLIKPYQTLPNLTKPYQILPNLTKPHQTLSNLTKPYQTLLNHTIPNHTKPYQTLPNLIKPCQTSPNFTKPY